MNPYDCISLYNIVSKNNVMYEPIYQFFKIMKRTYTLEDVKMDVEIAAVPQRKSI